jgi:hypothetical protein
MNFDWRKDFAPRAEKVIDTTWLPWVAPEDIDLAINKTRVKDLAVYKENMKASQEALKVRDMLIAYPKMKDLILHSKWYNNKIDTQFFSSKNKKGETKKYYLAEYQYKTSAKALEQLFNMAYSEMKIDDKFTPAADLIDGFFDQLKKECDDWDQISKKVASHFAALDNKKSKAYMSFQKAFKDPKDIQKLHLFYQREFATLDKLEPDMEFFRSDKFIHFVNEADKLIKNEGNLEWLSWEKLNKLFMGISDSITHYSQAVSPVLFTRNWKVKNKEKYFTSLHIIFSNISKALEWKVGYDENLPKVKALLEFLLKIHLGKYEKYNDFIEDSDHKNLADDTYLWKQRLSEGLLKIPLDDNSKKNVDEELQKHLDDLSSAEATTDGV